MEFYKNLVSRTVQSAHMWVDYSICTNYRKLSTMELCAMEEEGRRYLRNIQEAQSELSFAFPMEWRDSDLNVSLGFSRDHVVYELERIQEELDRRENAAWSEE